MQDLKKELLCKIDNLNKPKGSLGRMEEIALKIGLIQKSLTPKLKHPAHLLLASDHGIEKEGVSLSPREVTYQQMINFSKGGGAVNVLSCQHGIDLELVDLGVDYDLSSYKKILNKKISPNGTRNFLYEPAISEEELKECFKTGDFLVKDLKKKGSNIISIGEMGIANTSASSLWMHLLTNIPLKDCVGRGSGLDDVGVSHKLSVLQNCLKRVSPKKCKEIMKEFGGFEMVTSVGVMLSAYKNGMIVLIDGFIMSACALMAIKICPEFKSNAIFCHLGKEKGHKLLLESIGVNALLNLELSLGEGTGALLAYPLIESSIRLLNEMNSFCSSNITKYF